MGFRSGRTSVGAAASATRNALVAALCLVMFVAVSTASAAYVTIDEVEPNNSAATANVLPADGTIANASYYGGDQDWYSIEVTGGVSYVFETGPNTNSMPTMTDTYLFLYASDGATQIASNDDAGPGVFSYIAYTPPADGTLYLMSRHYNSGSGTGPYGARAYPVSSAQSVSVAGTVTNGILGLGGIEVTDYYIDEWFSQASSELMQGDTVTSLPDGTYFLSGVPGVHVVWFSDPLDVFIEQYYQGRDSMESADPFYLGSGEGTTSIDAAMVARPPLASDVAETMRASVSATGTEGYLGSARPAISADGRYVAFATGNDLDPGDTNGGRDVYVRDLAAGTLARVTVAYDGGDVDDDTFSYTYPAISADGRYVAFDSYASNLVDDDGNGVRDVFVRDMVTGTTVRASVSATGTEGVLGSARPAISADGRYVAFVTGNDLAADDTNGGRDVYVRDMVAGTLSRVTVAYDGGDVDDDTFYDTHPAISADGRYVAFDSYASNLVEDDGNARRDVFVRDMVSGTTVRASVDASGTEGNRGSRSPAISADGRYLAFVAGNDFDPADENGYRDVYVRDMLEGGLRPLTLDAEGFEGTPDYYSLSMSSDGRYVAFESYGPLVPGETNEGADVYVHDTQTGVTTVVSVSMSGMSADDESGGPCISADGRYVAFHSDAGNIVPDDSNDRSDVFVARRNLAAPSASDDGYGTERDTQLVVGAPGVLGNDEDADGDELEAELASAVSTGTLALAPDGSLTYDPPAGWWGEATFSYLASDGMYESDTATVTITVAPPPPVAADDVYETDESIVLAVPAPGVLGNDTHEVGEGMTADLVSDVTTGTLALASDGSFTYLPPAGFWGPATFEYRSFDGITYSETATATITVIRTSAPTAMDDAYETAEDTDLVVPTPGVLGNDTDPAGAGLSAELVSDVTTGTLALAADGSFTYSPPAGWTGEAEFAYLAADAGLDSEPATVTVTVTPVIPPPSGVTFTPVAGADRYNTAIAASQRAFPEGAGTVVVATGADWPDALGGAALAGAYDCPILLTRPGDLPSEVLAEIQRLDAGEAILLGSTDAVSEDVEDALEAELGAADVTRIGGADRYATANLIAAQVAELLGEGFGGRAFVATGLDFPDALAVSPVAFAEGMPTYLVGTNGLSEETKKAMSDASVSDVFVLGSTRAVAADVEADLKAALGVAHVSRLYGETRYTTALAVAQWGVDNAGLAWDGLALTTGLDFPDALVGGPLQGKLGSVMLATRPDRLDADVAAAIAANKAVISKVYFLGGTNVLGQTVRNQVAEALE